MVVEPGGFPNPVTLVYNRSLAQTLGLDASVESHSARLFSGTELPSDARPLAQAYAGHQFGGFSPQLGDGRALLLGEKIDPEGRRWDIQLKGSGRTPFSRGGDGKATLGPILREYLIGEAMFHLGVPTTRVLAAIGTGQEIRRDGLLPGAVLARVAASHLRVGTLQFFAARGAKSTLARVVDYTLARHHPDAEGANPAQALLHAVGAAQATLVAGWMSVGFVHGVMNTDNTTLSGETIDYGPCAFMDVYDPTTVFSSIDHQGRYAYGNQPGIAQWNLARMGEALLPLLDPDEEKAIAMVESALASFSDLYREAYVGRMRIKLGLPGAEDDDQELISGLLDWMLRNSQDHTLTMRSLTENLGGEAPFCDKDFMAWHAQWTARLGDDLEAAKIRMEENNPLYIPRNHKVEAALESAIAGDMAPFERLLAVLENPFERQEDHDEFANGPPADFGHYKTFCGT